MNNLDCIFYPKSIAIIGASRDPESVGNNILRNLVTQGYQGDIYPVNPKADSLYHKRVYGDIQEVGEVDLAIIAVPAKYVTEIAPRVVKKAKAIIVVSSGFKESGQAIFEKELQQICRSAKVPLIGPNCLGVINPEIKMNASFANIMPKLGNIAFVSQSGALCTTVIDYAQDLGLGFSKFISIGNKAGINELDIIEYLANDKQTKLIAIYSEELTDGPRLTRIAKSITRGEKAKPIIILKSGKTDLGSRAVISHTGSLSGSNEVYQALFSQSGLIPANSIQEFFNFMQIFSKNGSAKTQNIAIITNAGGPAVLATDAVAESGLDLAKFSPTTEKRLTEILPPAAHLNNPVDILGDAKADRYQKTLEVVEKDKNVEAILLLLTPQSMTEIAKTAKAIVEIRDRTHKPLVACFMGRSTVESGIKLIKSSNVISMNFPETAVRNLAAFNQFYNWSRVTKDEFFRFKDVDKRKVAEILKKARKMKKTIFPETEALEILKAYNFPLLKFGLATNALEAEKISQKIGDRVAMKIVSPDILHKSDVGGVLLKVGTRDVGEKYNQLIKAVSLKVPKAEIEGVLIEEMAPEGGIETIIGTNKNESLGTTIMFGQGGVYVEVVRDVSFGIVPITIRDAERMVKTLRMSKIFFGFRGGPHYDMVAVSECLGRLSQLTNDFPEIKELDINPLLVLPKGEGVKVLDAKILI